MSDPAIQDIQENLNEEISFSRQGAVVQIEETKEESSNVVQVVEVRQRKTFEQNVALVKEYLQTHNRLPNKRDEDPIVRNLGYFVADIRSKYTNTGLNIDQTNIDYVNE